MPDDQDDLAERARRGDLDAATLALAEQAIRSDPSDARARVIAARCFEAAGELDDAAAQLDEVLAMDPRHTVAHNRRERISKQLAARKLAEATLAEGRQRLIESAERAKDAERDIDFQIEARRLLAREDHTPEALCALAAALRRRRDYGASLQTYDQARLLDASPRTNPMAFTGRAAVLRDLRRWSESEAQSLQVLEHHPRSRHALSGLAALYLDIYETDHDNDRHADAERIIDQLPASAAHALRARLISLPRRRSR